MRAAFRKLGTLTLMAWGFLSSTESFAASERYYLNKNPEVYFSSISSACLSADLSGSDDPNMGYTDSRMTGDYSSYSSSHECIWTRNERGVLRTYHGYYVVRPAPSCVSDQTDQFSFPGTVSIVNGSPSAVVDAPSSYCSNACEYVRTSNGKSCSISGETSSCQFEFQTTGENCSSPPPTDDGGDTGGGDTGGGDTGGGDSGGGDSGGCASGIGCDNGSGSGGGGDSGGGDTGGGDTGGGDSGGGDSGGGDSGGGDTGGGDSGGGDTGGGGTGTTGGATSADIRNLGDRITNAIAGHYNSLASSIAGLGDRLTGKLDQLGDKVDQLNGPAFSEGDVPGEAGGTAPGSDAGNDLAGQITDAVDQAVAEREAGLRDDLGTIDGMVSDWFGPGGNNIDSNDLLGSMFPAPSGCRDYVLPVHRDIVLTLPVCRLAAIRPLLEWVFAVLTAIGVWRILMNGLLGSAGRSTSGRR